MEHEGGKYKLLPAAERRASLEGSLGKDLERRGSAMEPIGITPVYFTRSLLSAQLSKRKGMLLSCLCATHVAVKSCPSGNVGRSDNHHGEKQSLLRLPL